MNLSLKSVISIYRVFLSCSLGLGLIGCGSSTPSSADLEAKLSDLKIGSGLSLAFDVYTVDMQKKYIIDGVERAVGAGFQPSVMADDRGDIHVFFQARLDGSDDRNEKMIAHVVSRDGGKSYSDLQFVNTVPMQTYAISAYLRGGPGEGRRISLLTSLSIDETIGRLKDPEIIEKKLGIDVTEFLCKAATLVLEFFSDDYGQSWHRKEHRNVADHVYRRNGRDYYLAFINLIGQVRRMEGGAHDGRLILGGPLRGDYLPCEDHPHFRDYSPSSSLIFSDDDGESWNFGGVINDATAFAHNEASAVSVNDGRQVLLARRNNQDGAAGKTMHWSSDGGETWKEGFLTDVAATRCLQVLETHGGLVLCSTPGQRKRTHGTIYVSRDAGKTWSPKLIEEGPFSYSTVNRLVGDYLICSYSRGHHGEQGIAARIFSVEWLKDAK